MISAFYHKMLKFVNKLFGSSGQKTIKKYLPIVEKINSLEKNVANLSDEALREKTNYFKNLISEGASLDDILYEAFAVVREVSKRTLNLRHFDVQLIGGAALHSGKIAEM